MVESERVQHRSPEPSPRSSEVPSRNKKRSDPVEGGSVKRGSKELFLGLLRLRLNG